MTVQPILSSEFVDRENLFDSSARSASRATSAAST